VMIAQRATHVLCAIQLGSHGMGIAFFLALILLGESSNVGSGGFAQRRGGRAQPGSRGPILMKLCT